MSEHREPSLGLGTPESPRASATVLMLRDGAAGLEVFMLERHGLSDVLGGAYVFPGGKVDASDADLAGQLDQSPALLPEALGESGLGEREAAALYVAAIREVFEEAGVLFAALGGVPLNELLARRTAGGSFEQVVQAAGVPLASTALVPWSRWVTPLRSYMARKHFDARFFVATAPAGQEPTHDQHEATRSLWIAPSHALREYDAGRLPLAPPQIMSLSHLARFADVAAVMAYARSRKPPRIRPEAFEEDGVKKVCYPGDPRHSCEQRAMPGPTRLCWRNHRYEPDGGLAALFA